MRLNSEEMRPRSLLLTILAGGLIASPVAAQLTTKLRPETVRAFEAYVQQVERSLERRVEGKQSFLWVTEKEERRDEALEGEIVTHKFETKNVKVPGGLIHDWIGAMFIPDATAEQTIAVLQDFDHHKDYYPEVLESRLLSRQGDTVRSFLRLRKQKVLTVVLNTEHEARYQKLSGERWYMRSYSTKIAEVKDPDKPEERELPVGEDSGFLWRLNA